MATAFKPVMVQSPGTHTAGMTPGNRVLALNLLACTERPYCWWIKESQTHANIWNESVMTMHAFMEYFSAQLECLFCKPVHKLIKMVVSVFGLELSPCYSNESTFIVNRKTWSMSSGTTARLLVHQADKWGETVRMAAKQREWVRECKNWSVMLDRGQRPQKRSDGREVKVQRGRTETKQCTTDSPYQSSKCKMKATMMNDWVCWKLSWEPQQSHNGHKWSTIIQAGTQQAVTRYGKKKNPDKQTW